MLGTNRRPQVGSMHEANQLGDRLTLLSQPTPIRTLKPFMPSTPKPIVFGVRGSPARGSVRFGIAADFRSCAGAPRARRRVEDGR